MKTQVSLQSALGKPFEGAVFSRDAGQLLLCFGGGFCVLGIVTNEGGAERLDEQPLALSTFGDAALIESGVICAEELAARRDAARMQFSNRIKGSLERL